MMSEQQHALAGFQLAFTAEEGSAALDIHATGRPPVVTAAADGWRAWCCGELLSYRTEGDTQACLQQVVADRAQDRLRAARLNGRFILLLWEEASRAWEIITDRVGAMHAFAVYDAADRLRALGTELLPLAKAFSSRVLDWEAVASLFAVGFFLDDRTHFVDMRVLEPARVYRIAADGTLLGTRAYWEWFHEVDLRRPYDRVLDEYDALLRQAVARTTRTGTPILPLSGGLDSRSLAAVLPPGPETLAYAYGYTAESVETCIAGQIAAARGFTYSGHVITPYLFDRLPAITALLHGSQNITQARQLSVSAWIRARADAVLTGLWGDVWCDHMGLADGLPPGGSTAAHVVHKMEKRGRGWLLAHVAAPQLDGVDIPALLLAHVQDGMSAFATIDDPDFQVKAYKTAHWAFRWSNNSLRAFEPGGVPRVPYYDVDLVDFFCTVPTAFVRDRRLQIDHLKRTAPDLARIAWQETGANLFRAEYGAWLDLPGRAYRKVRRALTGARPIQRNWEVQFFSPGGQDGLARWLLEPGLRLHDFVAREDVAALLGAFNAQPDGTNGYTVAMLLSFSSWLEEALAS